MLSIVWHGDENSAPRPRSPGRAGSELRRGPAPWRRSLDEEPARVDVAEVDDVDPLEGRRRALVVVALDDQEAMRIERREIANAVSGCLHPVLPALPGVGLRADVELVDEAARLVGV